MNIAELSHIVRPPGQRYSGVEIILRIDVSTLPPCGELVAEWGETVSFVGWLGLLRCLSDFAESAGAEIATSGLDGKLNPRGDAEL